MPLRRATHACRVDSSNRVRRLCSAVRVSAFQDVPAVLQAPAVRPLRAQPRASALGLLKHSQQRTARSAQNSCLALPRAQRKRSAYVMLGGMGEYVPGVCVSGDEDTYVRGVEHLQHRVSLPCAQRDAAEGSVPSTAARRRVSARDKVLEGLVRAQARRLWCLVVRRVFPCSALCTGPALVASWRCGTDLSCLCCSAATYRPPGLSVRLCAGA